MFVPEVCEKQGQVAAVVTVLMSVKMSELMVVMTVNVRRKEPSRNTLYAVSNKSHVNHMKITCKSHANNT